MSYLFNFNYIIIQPLPSPSTIIRRPHLRATPTSISLASRSVWSSSLSRLWRGSILSWQSTKVREKYSSYSGEERSTRSSITRASSLRHPQDPKSQRSSSALDIRPSFCYHILRRMHQHCFCRSAGGRGTSWDWRCFNVERKWTRAKKTFRRSAADERSWNLCSFGSGSLYSEGE